MKKEKYVPYTEADWKKWYPGQINVERRRQLDELRYNAKDLTADDIIYLLTKGYTGLFHNMVKAMKAVVGEDATKEIITQYGYTRGGQNIDKMLKVAGTNDPTPEHWAWYQDAVHSAGGLEHSQAYSEYDDEKCVVRRTHCGLYTGDPETKEYCRYFHLGAHSAYNEYQPTVETKFEKCMAEGDDCCEDIFRRKKG